MGERLEVRPRKLATRIIVKHSERIVELCNANDFVVRKTAMIAVLCGNKCFACFY